MAEFVHSPNKNLEKMDCTVAMLEGMQVKWDNKPVKSCIIFFYNEVWGGGGSCTFFNGVYEIFIYL